VSSVNGTSSQCDVNDNVDGITDEGNNNYFWNKSWKGKIGLARFRARKM
jgi:hypothetical protein